MFNKKEVLAGVKLFGQVSCLATSIVTDRVVSKVSNAPISNLRRDAKELISKAIIKHEVTNASKTAKATALGCLGVLSIGSIAIAS